MGSPNGSVGFVAVAGEKECLGYAAKIMECLGFTPYYTFDKAIKLFDFTTDENEESSEVTDNLRSLLYEIRENHGKIMVESQLHYNLLALMYFHDEMFYYDESEDHFSDDDVFALLNKTLGITNAAFFYGEGYSEMACTEDSIYEYNAVKSQIYISSYFIGDADYETMYCEEKGVDEIEDEEDYWKWKKRHCTEKRTRKFSKKCFTVSKKIKDKLIDESTKRGYTELTAMLLDKLR